MSARKAKKRAHVSDSDHDSAEDEHPEVASITFPQFSGECSSWDAFHEELTRYQEETHQLYKTRSTNSVADRNKQHAYQHARWTFKPRGKGSRTNHNIRSIDYPAKLSAVLVQSGDGSYKVRVSKHIATHNHDVGRDVYYSYAEARKITSPGTRGVVKTLVQGGSKKKKILRYLKEISGKSVLPKDVENLVAKMRKETYTSEDDNERVAQTAHTRRMTRKFPEAICVDATYGTNINRYRLFSFMVTDKFGCGSFAQHALVDGESKLNMLCAIRAFKQNNPGWTDVKVIEIDKDFTELALLPRSEQERLRISAFEKMHIKYILTMLVRTEKESGFDDYLSALQKLCVGKPSFMDYFTENWLNCKDLWCTFERGNIPHLDNNANNRLEASWGAAKDLLHRHMAMDECIDHLLFLQQSAEDRYTTKVKRVGCRYNRNYDNEMAMLAKLATHHACNLVEEQYRASGQETYDISSDENTPNFLLSPVQNQTVLLPCRHILYLWRQRSDLRSIIPCKSIPERWLLADEDNEEDAGDPDTSQKFYVEDIAAPPSRVLGHNEKYQSGFAVCQKIAEVVVDKGSRSFRAWLDFLTQLEGVARHNDMPPSYRDLSIGVEVTNSGSVGERATNSDGVGEQITNVGEPIPRSSFVEQDANLDRADAGEDVTNSDDAGDNVTNSDDGGKDDTNLGSVLTPDSTPEIKIEKGARVELTSTPASARRKLDLDNVGSASSDEEIVNIVLNTTS
ncbi:hypothetical protein PC116_g16947 [Phytophthora cactorum]|nr:hypothetical protein PC116_g16947 [Phytophthora cactorum]